MITDEEIILNTIEEYDGFYGLSHNQEILTKISLKENLFTKENVVTVLNIFLFEQFDNSECYEDVRHEFLNKKYLEEHPKEVRMLVEENIKNYGDD